MWVSLERAIGVEMDVFCQVEVVRWDCGGNPGPTRNADLTKYSLARAGRPEQDHVLVPHGEFERLERLAPAVDREADRCPVVPVEFLGLGEPGLSQQARAFRAPAGRGLLAHPCLHERHLRRGRLLQAVGEDLPVRRQVARKFHDRLHPAPCRGVPDAEPVSANNPPSAHTS